MLSDPTSLRVCAELRRASGTIILSDGTVFKGESFGAPINADGEVVFNTGMVGYPESLTDPSYRGQILVFTYPLIGNYGVPSEELNEWGFSKNFESEEIHVRGVVCAKVSEDYSHWNAVMSFPEWLKKHGIPGITGVDTRALTKKLRENGVMLGRMTGGVECGASGVGTDKDGGSELIIEDPNRKNLVEEVSCKEVMTYEPRPGENPTPHTPHPTPITIVAYDCGMKRNILRSFLKRGVRVIRVPWNFDLSSADFPYDGVFFSNGPGDPALCGETIKQVQYAFEKEIPTFGICLGNQLFAYAIGDSCYKLKYGHRGANQPCIAMEQRNIGSMQRCIITSQNHGFAVKGDNLPKYWHVWFRNANDDSIEGLRHSSGKFFSVQFHPEACPGPEDAGYLFDEFIKLLSSSSQSHPSRSSAPARSGMVPS